MPTHTIDWYRTPLDPDLLKKLNERSDWLGLVQAGGYLVILIATGVATFFVWKHLAWYWLIPALALHGMGMAFTINGVHELVHGTVFKSRFLNNLFVHLFAWLGWHNHYLFWASHTEHHKYTLHAPDDLEIVFPLRTMPSFFLRHGFINVDAIWGRLRGIVMQPFGQLKGEWNEHIVPQDKPRLRRNIRLWAGFITISHVALAIVCIATGYWIIPLIISCGGIFFTLPFLMCNASQHIGLADYVPDFRLCCRTITLNPVFRFLYWQMNYHIEHHMYAGVPCYRLHALHQAVKHDLPPSPRGLIPAWSEIFFIQHRQRHDPDYQYVQPVPGSTAADYATLPRTTQSQTSTVIDTSAKPTHNTRGEAFRQWECGVCGFIYDEELGLPEEGIAPGTAWLDIPDDWSCPDCGVAKADFDMIEITGSGKSNQSQNKLPTPAKVNAPTTPVVIIGSGLAGYTVAKELRGQGVDRPITILSRDDGSFYSKPMLSNALAEGLTPDTLVKDTAAAMAERFKIEVVPFVQVGEIDTANHRVVTDQGDFAYGQLVLALGADQITLPIPGSGAERVRQVNDLESYTTFREELVEGGRVMLIGAGLIGCEFANDLVDAGYGVDIVDLAPLPLARLTPKPVGEAMRDALQDRGVNWHLDNSIASIESQEDGRLRCELANGDSVVVDNVLSAVGLRPRINLAQQAGLAVDRGVTVDAHLRTSDPDVFALGDCAQINGQLLPYILPLFESARALAHTLAGTDTTVHFPVMPVVVKTPACPIVTCPPPADAAGQWRVEGGSPDLQCEFVDAGAMKGFCLIGESTHRKHEFMDRMQPGAGVDPSAKAAIRN